MLRPALAEELPLWELYEGTFKSAKYIDLTHAFEQVQPVWPGFGSVEIRPVTAGRDLGDFATTGEEFTYPKQDFISPANTLTSHQYAPPLVHPQQWNHSETPITHIQGLKTIVE